MILLAFTQCIYCPFFIDLDTSSLLVHFQSLLDEFIVDIQVFELVQNVIILQLPVWAVIKSECLSLPWLSNTYLNNL
jgi:hypothetical protein